MYITAWISHNYKWKYKQSMHVLIKYTVSVDYHVTGLSLLKFQSLQTLSIQACNLHSSIYCSYIITALFDHIFNLICLSLYTVYVVTISQEVISYIIKV